MNEVKILVIEARYYSHIQDLLLDGVISYFKNYNASKNINHINYDLVTISGALEIPSVINMAINSGNNYDGYVCLGCVIRGETSHYDYVAEQSARGIMDLSMKGIPIVNGILTVENSEQAEKRADSEKGNKGGFVAQACIELIKIKKNFKNKSKNSSKIKIF